MVLVVLVLLLLWLLLLLLLLFWLLLVVGWELCSGLGASMLLEPSGTWNT